MPFFDSVEPFSEDPILSLVPIFAGDKRSQKVNLTLGVYNDSEGRQVVLDCVREAEEQLVALHLDEAYQPIPGNKDYIEHGLRLIFGENFRRNTIYALQSLGGTGALRLGGEFLVQEISKTIFVSEPSWPNHRLIFSRAGMSVHTYPYYDPKTHGLDFEKMCHAIKSMSPGSVLLLQPTCHNPSGVEPSNEQWKELSHLVKEQKILPFFDFAYQGFGIDLETDAYAIRLFYEEGHEMLVAHSFSKNFGLYGERVGLLAIVAQRKASADHVGSQMRQIIRSLYSMPPLYGARLVTAILDSPSLRKKWVQEVNMMRKRIEQMRQALVEGLGGLNGPFSFLAQQKGLFSFCGLTPKQVHYLFKEHAILMPSNGRINVAGLNAKNIDYVIHCLRPLLEPV